MEWSGAGASSNWGSGANWVGGSVPSDNAHGFFGHLPTGGVIPPPTDEGAIQQTVNLGSTDRTLRSLWFKAGLWYTLQGSGVLTLGKGGGDGAYLLMVNKGDAGEQSEHDIENRVRITDVTGYGRIENYSEGGLRIGGTFDLNSRNIRIGGSGATHLANTISGAGNIEVGPAGGLSTQPQLILSGNNKDWIGSLKVNDGGFAIIKADQAIGTSSAKHVLHGGTLGFRSHVGSPLDYGTPKEKDLPLEIRGHGIVRRAETEQIGAIYNDGGQNSLNMKVIMVGDQGISFGSRGDRGGGLDLRNKVSSSGPFIKVGPGLISLSYAGDPWNPGNQWTQDTILRGGVLRLGSAGALPSGSNLVLAGGILELGYGDFSRSLGTGAGELRWAGSGGFSAYGADRSVTIGGGPQLYWGPDSKFTPHFLKEGAALLLSSRYATHNITFTNHVVLGGQAREIRVERGVGNAHAIMSGMVYGAANSAIRKTGRGLLHLSIKVGGGGQSPQRIIIEDGAVRYPLFGLYFSNYNTRLAGGVLGLEGDYTRELGANDGQIQWTGSGGFAAYGGTRTVKLGQGVLPWGQPEHTANFVGADDTLRFGHYTADGTVVLGQDISLGNPGRRTIWIERGSSPTGRADVVLGGAINGTPNLWLVGDGRIDLTNESNFTQQSGPLLNIHGAELRLNRSGSLSRIANIIIGYGGTLYLDDLGTHDSETGGSVNSDRIRDSGTLFFEGGSLIYRRGTTTAVERVGALALNSGENSIRVFKAQDGEAVLFSTAIQRGDNFRSVLHFSEKKAKLRLVNDGSLDYNVGTVTGIIPWATAIRPDGSQGFAHIVSDFHSVTEGGLTSNYQYLLEAQESYEIGGEGGWGTAHNVWTSGGQVLGASRTINSLIQGGGNLSLGTNRTLTINSGGLITSGSGTRRINGSGQITTSNNRAFYVHAFGNLSVEGNVRFNGGMDLVKSQAGTLTLDSNVTHQVGDVHIHRGILDLKRGTLSIKERIWVGAGGHEAILRLAPNRWNQIVRQGGLPDITLNGTPYDPGAEYGGAQAILQMGGNTKLVLDKLHIENRGTIDWVGGEVGKANILWIDNLSFNNRDAVLFIRNWYEYEDILLVRNHFDRTWLPNIVFEGYQDYTTTWKAYDNNYIQITPFGTVPEPSTYGAILGALGIAAVAWRKRRSVRTDGEATPRRQ